MPNDKKRSDDSKQKTLSGVQKQKVLNDAKRIRESLLKEAKKYDNAKVSGRSKAFYERASELVKKEASRYTQKSVRSQLGKDASVSEKMAAEADFLKTFGRGSTATNVARRILSTRTEEGQSLRQTSQAGARFYGGLVSVWEGVGYENRDEAIVQAFGKRNLLQVMEELENNLGVDLLNMLSDPDRYMEAVNMIQSYVSERGLA